ncbi:DUF4190 domain-containing protein [Asanoa sp. WMMD1127]|uniref:DUF4190 domain-containing protein n=1 Tax=Asanoa sp. WMMD1127 TaxID=3016107 RepID=UPI0024178F22|nr:DUF4190 domain-containing protein [Asanoa sp. WMMD1127]MDG4822652.1 DUF4190 domain-containing protein [Asanoa sp. WMMD1127]
MTNPNPNASWDPTAPPPSSPAPEQPTYPVPAQPGYPPAEAYPATTPEGYPPAGYAAGPGYPAAPGYPAYPPAGYVAPAGAYPGYGYPPVAKTNGLAIAALVCALAGLATCISAPVGAILGHVARKQIRERGESGDGMALAGIIVGWILTALILGYLAFVVIMIVIGAREGMFDDPYAMLVSLRGA